MSALYILGILDSAALRDAEGIGPGLGGAEVSLVESRCGLAALVTDNNGASPEPTRRNMMAHTTALERAITRADVLPMRFGTVAPGVAQLDICLTRHVGQFRTALAGVEGRIELGVKASWRDGIAFREILAADSALKALRDRLQSRPTSQTYHERIELGRRVEAALGRLRQTDTAAIEKLLAPLSENTVALKNLDEAMVLNQAFLVRREVEAAFDAAMRHLAELQEGRMLFRYIGPVPPYNFVTLRADWLAQAA
jgi:hypothetical protein